ncbi:MAG: peptidoglycan-binding protein [Granulosicoccus sp.]|nr:peptidoglycan-binding protein [Granulosicoccus sp.]
MLAGCGGSSGDTVPLGEQDFDGDTIINSEDPDADGDDILDTEDNFVDLDSDGLDDITLQTEAEANGTQFVDVSPDNVCGSEDGLDNSSENDPWNDNCVVKRFGQFADSLFAVGIQRVLFCDGYGSGTDYTAFADGEIGPGSEAAIKAFQSAQVPPLVDDGIVGPATWGALQGRIVQLAFGQVGVTPDTWGFDTGVCADIPMFYQETSASPDNSGVILGGWTLAKDQPNTDQETPFSYEEPFGRL